MGKKSHTCILLNNLLYIRSISCRGIPKVRMAAMTVWLKSWPFLCVLRGGRGRGFGHMVIAAFFFYLPCKCPVLYDAEKHLFPNVRLKCKKSLLWLIRRQKKCHLAMLAMHSSLPRGQAVEGHQLLTLTKEEQGEQPSVWQPQKDKNILSLKQNY